MAPADFVPFALPDIGEAEIGAVADAMRSGWLTSGPRVAAFEAEFAQFLGGDVTAVAVNSATAGLHLALEACGVRSGDEVLVPDWTFTATAEVVRYLDAEPVIVDVDPVRLNIDYAAAERAITPRTTAVMPVHFAGCPVDRAATAGFAARHGLKVIEDAAHCFPALSRGELIGRGSSDAVVFSFYATKTMTTGEGGMVIVNDAPMAARVRTMRLHGISRDVFDRYRSSAPSWFYEVVDAGYKYNLTDPAAAMGRVQLRRAEEMWLARRALASRYREAFADLPIHCPAEAGLPGEPEGSRHAWHLFVLRLRDDAPVGRDEFIEAMAALGVGCSVHFIPLHRHPYYRDRYGLAPESFPVAEREFARAVSLPLFSSMTEQQREKVVSAVREVLS